MFKTYNYCDLNNPSHDLLRFVATTSVVVTNKIDAMTYPSLSSDNPSRDKISTVTTLCLTPFIQVHTCCHDPGINVATLVSS